MNDDKINESCQNKKDEIVIPLLRNQEKEEKNVGDGDGLSQLKLLNNILKEPINNNERNEFHEFEHENIGNIESEKYLLGLFENFIKYHEHLLKNLELILGIRNKIEKYHNWNHYFLNLRFILMKNTQTSSITNSLIHLKMRFLFLLHH